jgi:phenol/toluene 2-monooxygenase (NADH) P0/A0
MQSHDGITCQPMPMTMTSTSATAPFALDDRACDVSSKFVRIKQLRADGLVCFEFAIGWPELFVDLLLRSAFDDFCVRQKVQLLSD